jgi:hypothetical protein
LTSPTANGTEPIPGETKAGARAHRKRGASALPYLIGLGLVFAVLAFSTTVRSAVVEHVDLEGVMLAAVAFLCFHAAYSAASVHRLRERLLDLLAETMQSLKGPDLTKNAEAIDILVKSLGAQNPEVRKSAHAHLVRLTGTDLGETQSAWSNWWAQARREAVALRRGGES